MIVGKSRAGYEDMMEKSMIDAALIGRHSEQVHTILQRAHVAIMGLGGLGSSVAVSLARIGVGKLLLADYDVVELSNLNRQYYFLDQLGLAKTEATRRNLQRINPYIAVELINERLTEESIPQLFS